MFINHKFRAFTLAEMLIVLVILSLVMVSLPRLAKKQFAVKNIRVPHGRYECYWERSSSDSDPVLKYYYAKEKDDGSIDEKVGTLQGDKCVFTPPLTYPYMIFHAVGGGGAGGNLTQAYSTANLPLVVSYEEYSRGETQKYTKWFSYFLNNSLKPQDSGKNLRKQFQICDKWTYCNSETDYTKKSYYYASVFANQNNLKYRKSGNAGAVVSMFFPAIPSGRHFYLYPGLGGSLQAEDSDGENGGDTVVQVVEPGKAACSKDDSNAVCNIIYARGGSGAVVLDSDGSEINTVYTDFANGGKSTDYGISAMKDVNLKLSGFSNIIDSVNKAGADTSSTLPTNAGDGGRGANYFTDKTTGFIVHQLNNFYGNEANPKGKYTNWITVSKYMVASLYGNKCELKQSSNPTSAYTSGANIWDNKVWVPRNNSTHSTYCYGAWGYPSNNYATAYMYANPQYIVCAVGDINYTGNQPVPACNNAYDALTQEKKCARYVYEKQSDNTYKLVEDATTNNMGKTKEQLKEIYSRPELIPNLNSPNYSEFTVYEALPSSLDYIGCPSESGYQYANENKQLNKTPCASGSMDFDTTKNICKPQRGGDGAIVILW